MPKKQPQKQHSKAATTTTRAAETAEAQVQAEAAPVLSVDTHFDTFFSSSQQHSTIEAINKTSTLVQKY